MKTFRVLVVLAVVLVTASGFAQQPTLVWEREFTLGVPEGAPSGMQGIPSNGFFVNGHSVDSFTGRATIAGFSSDGSQQWLRRDSSGVPSGTHTSTFSGHLAVIPRDNAVVWFEGARGSYDPSWIVKFSADGTEQWRLPVNRLMFLGNDTDSTFVSILPGNNPIAFFHRANGAVWRQFPLGGTLLAGSNPIVINRTKGTTLSVEFPFSETIESIVTPITRGNFLWVGGQYPGGVATSLSYLVAKYDITTGQQVWIQRFVDVAKGFVGLDPETGDAYLWGTKVVDDPRGWPYLLKFVKARLTPDGGLDWQREFFSLDSLNSNNWANSSPLVVGSGSSKQVVFVGAIQRGTIANSSSKDARAYGVKASNGDSVWSITRTDASLCGFQGVVRTDGNSFVLLESVFQLAAPGVPSNGYGKLLKFLAPTLSVRELPGLPESFRLHQNYPNPFNPSTTIRFELMARTPVRLAVYDLLGREMKLLVNETLEAGIFEETWDASGMPSGTYFYRLTSDTFVQTKRMVLVK